ncbi:hypothetical protein BpHYR1_051097 [Brachionus plicatilis]|uniref:Uncharacterized protein n=1 Tax=Brachionus plicatilis TaxID=10195 RepID=A0A3M7PGT3_BRAPC|nr:hypothetical protein BpHYR1_051097 [Brachionus plicatilis]
MDKENRELFNYLVLLGLILPFQNCTNDSCLKKGKDLKLHKFEHFTWQSEKPGRKWKNLF